MDFEFTQNDGKNQRGIKNHESGSRELSDYEFGDKDKNSVDDFPHCLKVEGDYEIFAKAEMG